MPQFYTISVLNSRFMDVMGKGGKQTARRRRGEGTGRTHYFRPFPRWQANPLLNQRAGI